MISETKEEYIKLEKKCTLENGDTVKVIRAAKHGEQGWPKYWWPVRMVAGQIGIVIGRGKNGDGIKLKTKMGTCHYPYFILEKIETPKIYNGELKYLNEGGAWVESINKPEKIISNSDYLYHGSTRHDGKRIYSYYAGHQMLYRYRES